MKYDILILDTVDNNDLSGQCLAVKAAKLGLRVAIVLEANSAFAVSPSTPAWETLLATTYHRKTGWNDFKNRVETITMQKQNQFQDDAALLFIDQYQGDVQLIDEHHIEIATTQFDAQEKSVTSIIVETETVVIATGATCKPVSHLPYNGTTILSRDDFFNRDQLPQSLVLVSEKHDSELTALLEKFRISVTLIPDFDDVVSVTELENQQVEIQLANNTRFVADCCLIDAGRIGNTSSLNLESAGVSVDDRNQLWCNEDLQTWVPNIYGVGEVVGYSGIDETDSLCDFDRILAAIQHQGSPLEELCV